jgi:hypothetical protein
MIALTNATPGATDEYERWSKAHLRDVLEVPGVKSGECLRLVGPEGAWQYLTTYEVETDDVPGLLREIRKRVGGARMPMSASLDVKTAYMGVFAPR